MTEGRKTPQGGILTTSAAEPMSTKPPRGTHDILPAESSSWQALEDAARRVFKLYGYGEIRLPIFEHTELFKRGVGDTTDIVNKEMYTFSDKSDRSLTLRPEGTAGVVRAYLNGGLHRHTPPVKLWYLGPMFRYERAQTGRQRQFHQIGVEVFGSPGPLIDAEVLLTAVDYLQEAGIKNFELQLNSIGCPVCRPAYRELLRDTLRPRLERLCADCNERFDRNPLRMLDCKIESCQAEYKDIPSSLDHLCGECQSHWDGLKGLLDEQKVAYTVNPRLVRGLDYYTRTVLEIVTRDPRLGTQSTILAGGRYDHLVETLGGPHTPAVGWALGLERLFLLLDAQAKQAEQIFVVSSNPQTALKIATDIRRAGIHCEMDHPSTSMSARNFGKQLQHANKIGARWTVIAGDDELARGEVLLKDMQGGEQEPVPLDRLTEVLLSKQGK